jgi:hypothetical protein
MTVVVTGVFSLTQSVAGAVSGAAGSVREHAAAAAVWPADSINKDWLMAGGAAQM